MSDKVAILGAGLVGSAWAIVFARAGHAVSLYDGDGAQSRQALARVGDNMRELFGFGLLDDADAALARISIAGNLAEALDGKALDWQELPGEGAFYGPKIEFSLKDCIGRVWQLGTIQVDFSMPGRLDAQYVAADGSRQVAG